MLFKPKDESEKYHGDCSYGRSAWPFSGEESPVPIEVVNFCMVHTGHFIVWLRRYKRDK